MLDQTQPPQSKPQPGTPSLYTRKQFWGALAGLIVGGIVIAAGAAKFRHAGSSQERAQASVPVAVVAAEPKDLSEAIELSGEFYPYQEIALHAKVAGYLKSIAVDVGDHVKEGEKIGELEIPELEEDCAKANADLLQSQEEVERATAEYCEARLAFERLEGVQKANPKLVAQQDLDKARAHAQALKGALGGAEQKVLGCKSQVEKMKTLLGYAQITIPFDGVVTRRYADPGALIQAGISSSTQTLPLIELAQENRLRLKFPVPESAVARIRVGLPVEISIGSLHETFQGQVARFTGKVDRSTRTMLTEIDVPNPEGRFKPGMYANVRLILDERKSALAVPVQAVVSGEKPSIYVLAKSGVIEQRPVSLGLQTPEQAEVISGLKAGEWVIVGNRSNLRAGARATPIETNLASAS